MTCFLLFDFKWKEAFFHTESLSKYIYILKILETPWRRVFVITAWDFLVIAPKKSYCEGKMALKCKHYNLNLYICASSTFSKYKMSFKVSKYVILSYTWNTNFVLLHLTLIPCELIKDQWQGNFLFFIWIQG